VRTYVSLAVFLLVLPFCDPTSALDVHAYQLRQVEVTPSEARQAEHRRVWLNTLRFDGRDSEIKLSRSMAYRLGDTDARAGFDAHSLTMTWLDPDHLVHVEWATLPEPGSGSYSWEGHVVLLLEGTSLKELFRDTFQAYGQVGMGNYERTHLRIRFEASSATLRLDQADEGSTWEPSSSRRPAQWKHKTVWQYQLREGALRFMRADRFATVEGNECALAKIARRLRTSTKTLERLNPHFASAAPCTARISDQIGPYHPTMEDGVE